MVLALQEHGEGCQWLDRQHYVHCSLRFKLQDPCVRISTGSPKRNCRHWPRAALNVSCHVVCSICFLTGSSSCESYFLLDEDGIRIGSDDLGLDRLA